MNTAARRFAPLILLALPPAALAAAAPPLEGAFTDPAPPAVHPAPDKPAITEAVAFDRLTFHRGPSPLAEGATVDSWPRLLGSRDNAVSAETHLRKSWPEGGGPPVVWEVERGAGYASPTIVDGRFFLFHRLEDREVLDCLHPETGRRFWTRSDPVDYEDRYNFSNGPRAGPVADGERVYTYGVTGRLTCVHAPTGTVIWARHLSEEFTLRSSFFGAGSTPLVHRNLLVINLGTENNLCVAAFDKLTGRLVWGTRSEWGASYASPVVARLQGADRILVFAGGESRPSHGGLLCIDPADGAALGAFPWRSDEYESVNAATPVVVGENRVFISECYSEGGVLLRYGPDLQPKVVWRAPRFGVHFMTPVLVGGHLYGFDGRHMPGSSLVCYDVATGAERWREFIRWKEPVGGRPYELRIYRGSLLAADGAFLCHGELGSLHWLDLNPDGAKVLARAKLFLAEESWTLPALTRGLLYASQNGVDKETGKPPRVVCYDLRGP